MRILFVTNYYPPSDQGWGYMQLCEEVADGLAARGHTVAVLTSTHRDGPEITRPYPVHRLLTIDPDWQRNKPAAWQFFVGRRQREREEVTHLIRLVQSIKPQVIFIWHAVGLPRVLLQAAELQPNVVTAYYLAGYLPELSDEYIAYWNSRPVRGFAQALKRPLARLALAILRREGKPIPLKYENVICVSGYVRQRLVDQGLILCSSTVIHNGVDLSVFTPSQAAKPNRPSEIITCLVAGRIVPDKGIHTVIDAFAVLGEQASQLHLTILGDGPRSYLEELKAKVQASGLQGNVFFQPPILRSEMPHMLEQYQVLLLPSEYAEPIARSMQEAMAMGLLVIGTTTGGSGELLAHEQTGLVFDAGDAHSLAEQIKRVIDEPDLAARLAIAGQIRVREAFRIDQTVGKIEAYLQTVLSQNT